MHKPTICYTSLHNFQNGFLWLIASNEYFTPACRDHFALQKFSFDQNTSNEQFVHDELYVAVSLLSGDTSW